MVLEIWHLIPFKALPGAGFSHSGQALSPSKPYLERVSVKSKRDRQVFLPAYPLACGSALLSRHADRTTPPIASLQSLPFGDHQVCWIPRTAIPKPLDFQGVRWPTG